MVPLARGLRTPVRLPAVSRAEPMSGSVVLDAAGRRRSPATMPGFHAGHPPRNKGLRYPADPPTVEEIVAVMRIAGDGLHGRRLRGLIVVFGAPIFASTKRSRCARPTSIAAAVQSLSVAAKEDDVARSGWTTGAGRNLNHGSLHGSPCRSVRCSASSTEAPAVARGPRAGHVPSCGAPRLAPAYADASHRISCATPTLSRWLAKACR